MKPKLWTVGHSSRELAAFLELLAGESIALLADVRRFPGSRRQPHFGQDELRDSLANAGIEYQHFTELGGRRTARADDSPNVAWRVEAFNAYADYMLTPDFERAASRLAAQAQQRRTAIMCSEALPWQCHRRLIADLFVARGWEVLDIVGPRNVRPHVMPAFARVVGEKVTYPRETLF